MKTKDIIKKLNGLKARSKWDKSVLEDALFLLESCEEDELFLATFEKKLLDGADSWEQFSWGGCALVYNSDLARHYCTPSELRRTKNGRLPPNKNEQWLDVQARALYQACNKIREMLENEN